MGNSLKTEVQVMIEVRERERLLFACTIPDGLYVYSRVSTRALGGVSLPLVPCAGCQAYLSCHVQPVA